MIADADIWQVMCGEDIYQADLATLKQWVAEGLVQQTDQVRKGSLRWLEAGRVPTLRRVFTGEEQHGEPTAAPESHAQPAHAGLQQAAHDLPAYHAGPPEPANFTHTAHPHPPQPAPPQHYAPDTFAAPFAPPAEQYSGAVFVTPDPAPDAFDAPRYDADPSRYAPETSHYAVVTSAFTPEAADYAPARPQSHAPAASLLDAPAPQFAAHDGARSAHAPRAADPFYVPQTDQPEVAPAATPQYTHVPDRREFAERAAAAPSLRALGRACYAHPQQPPRYVCRVCQTPMCQSCAKFMAGDSRTALCPLCGDFCNDYQQVYQQARNQMRKASGFGLGDFGEAVGYPFRNLLGLVAISILYSLLSLGGIKGQIIAYVVIFGCMSLVIKQLAWGRMDRGFLPDFTSMSLWDDVAVPCFLGFGITVVTLGPAIVLLLALLFGIVNGGPAKATQPAGGAWQQEQSQLADDSATLMNPDAADEEIERARANIARQRAKSLPGVAAPRGADAGLVGTVTAGLAGSLILVPLLIVALAWAFFYYPMALSVAGYTEDFWAVVNPAVGFDTIRRMGRDYVKVFLMYAAVQLFAVIAGLVVSYALSAFDMPFVGNVPARFVEGGINFYTSLVIAALLGLALYKSSDRLGIATD
ncbi:MAG TPA: hypothetical protein VK421_15595 [Pyrinomonadaceae bacterium]|nr:hypothetical protein [Pyrinomonadaceae bacterium]